MKIKLHLPMPPVAGERESLIKQLAEAQLKVNQVKAELSEKRSELEDAQQLSLYCSEQSFGIFAPRDMDGMISLLTTEADAKTKIIALEEQVDELEASQRDLEREIEEGWNAILYSEERPILCDVQMKLVNTSTIEMGYVDFDFYRLDTGKHAGHRRDTLDNFRNVHNNMLYGELNTYRFRLLNGTECILCNQEPGDQLVMLTDTLYTEEDMIRFENLPFGVEIVRYQQEDGTVLYAPWAEKNYLEWNQGYYQLPKED